MTDCVVLYYIQYSKYVSTRPESSYSSYFNVVGEYIGVRLLFFAKCTECVIYMCCS